MIQFNNQCKVCAIIKQEGLGRNSLGRRIYNSQIYVPGGEPLTDILENYKDRLKYQSLYNHTKKHQAPTAKALNEAAIRRASNEIQAEQIREGISYKKLQEKVIQQVLTKLEAGELKLTVKDGLQASKQLSDKEDKQIDQQTEMMRMVALFASGEIQAPGLAKGETTGDIIEGEIADAADTDPAASFFATSDQ